MGRYPIQRLAGVDQTEEMAEGENRKLMTIRHSYSGPQRPNIHRLRKTMLLATLPVRYIIYLLSATIIVYEGEKCFIFKKNENP
jgi:hypothetical protein